MIMGESDSENDETLRLRKKGKLTRKDLSRTRAQASTPQNSLLSLSVLQAEVSEMYRLREKLQAAPCSLLRSYFRTLKMNTSDKRPCRPSGSGCGKPSVSCLSGLHEAADPKQYTQAVQEEEQTKLTNSDDVLASMLSPNCFNLLLPTTVPYRRIIFLSFFIPQTSEIRIDKTSRAADDSQAVSHPCRASPPYLPARKPNLFLSCLQGAT